MEKINKLRKLLNNFNLDGYIIPKNDEFFGEYTSDDKDRLKYVTNFTGSFGFALILKSKNFLFVDGRYTLQAKKQSGKFFKVFTIPSKFPSNICCWCRYTGSYVFVFFGMFLISRAPTFFFNCSSRDFGLKRIGNK